MSHKLLLFLLLFPFLLTFTRADASFRGVFDSAFREYRTDGELRLP